MRGILGMVAVIAGVLASMGPWREAAANPTGYTGVSTTGCGGCHGAGADAGINLSLTGQQILAPGAAATYTLAATKTGVNTQPFGLNVSTSDGSGLSIIGGQSTQKLGEEITHTSPPKTMSGTPTASGNYQFMFTMPAAAAAGSDHTLRAALAIDIPGGWQLATYTVYVMPVSPTSASTSGATLGSINLSWSGGGPQYRVVYKPGSSAPTSITDGTATDVGSTTSTTVTGLSSGTEYSFAVYSKVNGAAIYSTAAATATASTSSSSVSFAASALATGGNHTCALTGAGAVKCWGANGSGQLGNNSNAQETNPADVSGLGSGVAAITAGFAHTCALTTGGGVKCWGANASGQLGDNTTTPRLVPVDVSGLTSGVAAIAAGNSHTCALTAAGGVKCWGQGISGELGDNAGVNRLAPVDVSGLTSGVMAIAAGGAHSCAVTTGGAAKCWGANSGGQLGDNTTTQRLVPVDVSGLAGGVAEITAGGNHTCARTSGGAAKCWGDNPFGQLGDNSQSDRLVPTDVVGLATGVAGISAGSLSTCALTTSGAIHCWGNNGNGGIGDGTQLVDRLVPTAVYGLSSGMTAVSAGNHSCALTPGGGIRCWGNNFNGQLGDGSSGNVRLVPVDVGQFAGGVLDAAAGGSHTCAVNAEGGVRCWGNNTNGRLGDNTTTQRVTPTDVMGLLRGVAAVATGFEHSCALTTGGGVKCWGRNNLGQLGDGSTTERLARGDVSGLTSGVAAIAAGFSHTCALTTGGAVKCWGSGTSGQLGDNATTTRLTPVDVSGLASGVSAISAGAAHTCALLASGAAKCWGDNTYGQVGDNTQVQRLVPTDVSGLASGVAEIAAGGNHNCARTTGGGVKCWGWNNYGMIGDNTQTDRYAPVDVSGLASGVAAIAAGNLHNCAVTSAGALKCWGNNGNGQIGDNTQFNNRLVPTDVLYLTSGMAGVTAGGSHTCAFTLSGGMSCWGNNFNGQLGDGATTNRPTPLGVLGLGGGTQSIAFTPPATGSVGAPINLSGTASSGLAVLFDTWTPTICSVSGNTVTPNATGLCGVRAVQAGSGVYPAAARARLLVISPANIVTYNLVLEGWQQVSPYVATTATGSGTASFNVGTKQLTLNLPYSGLSSGETGAHIHGPAARGANAGVLFTLAGANPKTDSVTLSAAQETQLNAGQLYVNIHTSNFPSGELRAQIDNLGATVTRLLTVTKAGTGAGTVTGTAEPGNVINCGSDCSETVPNGKAVTLNASPATGSEFAGWSGGGCTGTGPCTVTMNANATVTATFSTSPTTTYNLVLEGWQQVSPYVVTSATGTGTATFNNTTKVLTLNLPYSGLSSSETGAHIHGPAARGANAGVLFTLAGANPKTDSVTLSAAQETQLNAGQLYVNIHTSNFPSGELRAQIDNLGATVTRSLTVTKAGTGTGTVTGTAEPGTVVNCGSDCSETVPSGKAVALSAAASAGSTFAGWSGGCSGTGACNVTLTSDVAVTATFTASGGAAGVSLSATSVDFGGQSMGTTSPPVAVTVTNTGSSTLAVSSVTSSNGQFAATHNCASVAPSATCTVNATFTPAPAGGAINSTTAASGTLSIASNATGSPHAVSLSGTGEKSLVSHYYQAILRRAADPGGKAYWQNEAARVAALGANVNEVWFALSGTFFTSPEYLALNRANTGFVTDLYNTFFNRAPDSGGLAYWVGQLDSGMPREVLIAQFLFSPEFGAFTTAIYGTPTTRAEVNMVTDFYRGVLGRLPDDGGFNYWVQRFRTAQCAGGAALISEVEAISSAFTLSGEYSSRGRDNTRYIGDLYNAFLRRGGDLGGVQYWIAEIDSGRRTREQVRVEFKNSPEFQVRVNAVGQQGCLP